MSTLTLATPSTFCIADSTDEEHEEHVIPSIDRVASEFCDMLDRSVVLKVELFMH